MSNRKIKPVSFSLEDEHEYKLLQYLEQKDAQGRTKNFSREIKRLIYEDMNKKVAYGEAVVVSYDKEYTEETKEAMSSFF